jgi:hypothetical protein
MSFGTDRIGIEKRCYVCESPTKSHPAPNGWVCHTCKTETDDQTLLDALDIQPYPSPTFETPLECWWCHEETTLANIMGANGGSVQIGVGFDLFSEFQGLIITSCPSCLQATDHVTTDTAARRIADLLSLPAHEYDPRNGWVIA